MTPVIPGLIIILISIKDVDNARVMKQIEKPCHAELDDGSRITCGDP